MVRDIFQLAMLVFGEVNTEIHVLNPWNPGLLSHGTWGLRDDRCGAFPFHPERQIWNLGRTQKKTGCWISGEGFQDPYPAVSHNSILILIYYLYINRQKSRKIVKKHIDNGHKIQLAMSLYDSVLEVLEVTTGPLMSLVFWSSLRSEAPSTNSWL